MTTLWLNIWREPRRQPPYEVTDHRTRDEAIEAIADDVEAGGRAYVCTLVLDPETLDEPRRVDLWRLAEKEVQDRELDRMAQNVEAGMLRWRQAGM